MAGTGFIRIKPPFANGEPRAYKRLDSIASLDWSTAQRLDMARAVVDGLVLALDADDRPVLFLPDEWSSLKRVRPEAA
jgi:hypothetical protein